MKDYDLSTETNILVSTRLTTATRVVWEKLMMPPMNSISDGTVMKNEAPGAGKGCCVGAAVTGDEGWGEAVAKVKGNWRQDRPCG